MRNVLGASCAVVVLMASGSVMAQGQFLDRGASGIGLTAGVKTNDDFSTLSLAAGYSFQGVLDIGALVHRYSFDSKGAPVDITALGIQPSVTFHPLKHSDGLPVSVADEELPLCFDGRLQEQSLVRSEANRQDLGATQPQRRSVWLRR